MHCFTLCHVPAVTNLCPGPGALLPAPMAPGPEAAWSPAPAVGSAHTGARRDCTTRYRRRAAVGSTLLAAAVTPPLTPTPTPTQPRHVVAYVWIMQCVRARAHACGRYMVLLATAVALLPLREWSLTRRVQLWIFGTSASSTASSPPLPAHARELFIGACHLLVLLPPSPEPPRASGQSQARFDSYVHSGPLPARLSPAPSSVAIAANDDVEPFSSELYGALYKNAPRCC